MKHLKLALITLLILISTAAQAQKTTFCKNLENALQKDYPGSEIGYNDNCLIVKYPLILIAQDIDLTKDEIRPLLDKAYMNLFTKVYINEIMPSSLFFTSEGFYYIQIKFKDDHRHAFRVYSSSKLKIQYHY